MESGYFSMSYNTKKKDSQGRDILENDIVLCEKDGKRLFCGIVRYDDYISQFDIGLINKPFRYGLKHFDSKELLIVGHGLKDKPIADIYNKEIMHSKILEKIDEINFQIKDFKERSFWGFSRDRDLEILADKNHKLRLLVEKLVSDESEAIRQENKYVVEVREALKAHNIKIFGEVLISDESTLLHLHEKSNLALEVYYTGELVMITREDGGSCINEYEFSDLEEVIEKIKELACQTK